MLVHFVKPNMLKDADGLDYDDCKVIAHFKIKDYQRFIKFIQAMKGHECSLGNEWYTIDSFIFCLPQDFEHVPCIKVFVIEYFA